MCEEATHTFTGLRICDQNPVRVTPYRPYGTYYNLNKYFIWCFFPHAKFGEIKWQIAERNHGKISSRCLTKWGIRVYSMDQCQLALVIFEVA